MRIRTKLAFVEVIFAVGFLLTIGIVLFYTNSIVQLKDFEINSNSVMVSMRQMNTETQNLMTAEESLLDLWSSWTQSISDFERQLNRLSDSQAVRVLTNEQQKQLDEVVGWWDQIYEWYYTPAIELLEKMWDGDARVGVASNGLFQTLIEIQSQPEEDAPDYYGDLVTMRNYQDLVLDETMVFSDRLITLNQAIQTQIDQNIRNSTRIMIAILVTTLLITFFISRRFSTLFSRRLQQVEEAIRNISRGDFSTELKIKSKDEFEELSQHYNTFRTQLQEKLNSILDFMVSISVSQLEELELDRTLDLIAEASISNTEADGAAVYLIDEGKKALIPHIVKGRFAPPFPVPEALSTAPEAALNYARENGIPLGGENIVGKAVESTNPVFIRSLDNDETDHIDFHREHDDPFFINSLITTPLKISQRLLGAIVITKQTVGDSFTDLDFTHMQTFADYAALTIENMFNYQEIIEKREMHREIEIAADIQRDLLPGNLPEISGAQISAFSKAARGISGDYYDAFLIDKDKLGIVICDVVGKGVPASLLMVMIRTIIRMVASPQRSPAELLTLLNHGIIGRIGTEHFATMSIFSYDIKTREVVYSNAAHPPLLLYRSKEDQYLEIDTPGLPIGIEQKEKYHLKRFKVSEGDILLLFTDGIPETRSPDGREYSNELLKKNIHQVKDKSAQEITAYIQSAISRFQESADQHDDQTMVLMKIGD